MYRPEYNYTLKFGPFRFSGTTTMSPAIIAFVGVLSFIGWLLLFPLLVMLAWNYAIVGIADWALPMHYGQALVVYGLIILFSSPVGDDR